MASRTISNTTSTKASTLLRSTTLALAIAGSLIQASAFAQAARTPAAPATAPAKGEKVSLLAGKLSFSLPSGFVGNKLPPGSATDGAAGATGTIYVNQALQQVVLNTEAPVPGGTRVQDNDAKFLDGATTSFVEQQRAALPDYQRLGEKSMTIKGVGLRQLDAIGTFGGTPTRSTMLVAGSGNTMALIRIMSKADDAASHNVLVSTVIDNIKSGR
ncbi:hypothetical protein FXN63_19695 [Pigmentiphaga aceris]|uniref:Uncharacterized protein n=1 Tax=Pigmentiphaga aceris TaxID=1940612 RepID=A0A5C0AZE5_9BURK|nr:hypothetical protein [Pigmentiphaga aceris]QEI07809.1 hypothetical protein FXN63_19695 [Pigmentiphaga aceris]